MDKYELNTLLETKFLSNNYYNVESVIPYVTTIYTIAFLNATYTYNKYMYLYINAHIIECIFIKIILSVICNNI